MKPLIKWPGGKTRELKVIKDHIPDYSRYFEPFFGGGAVSFHLEPQVAEVNDIDTLLITFYQDVKEANQDFFAELNTLNQDWNKINSLLDILDKPFRSSIHRYLENSGNGTSFENQDRSKLFSTINDLRIPESSVFETYLQNSIGSKIKRVAKLQTKHDLRFKKSLMRKHLLTAIKSAYYFYIRDELFNITPSSAVFYFIREFCYGSMFRFNSKGDFNIPYGGINYNTKDFASKIAHLQSDNVQTLLKGFSFHQQDFFAFLEGYNLKEGDFIFLDPPYDSDFKNYGKNPFGVSDQTRLASYLKDCEANWLLVIQKTDLIWDLYSKMREEQNITILTYDKKYTYNVRGRNDRDTSHLLIKNY